jgi:hypothetical protein
METIFQIIPALPPSINGLGDYALNLARQLRDDFAIDTCFIVADPNWLGGEYIEGFTVSKLSSRSKHTLLDALQMNACKFPKVLLHYVGYGYAKRGCPFWLIDALQHWRQQSPSNHQVATIFHELYASSHSPLTSSFWLSRFQRNLTKRLLLNSNRIITNREENSKILQKLGASQHLDIRVLPVFSTLGEPDNLLPLSKRKKRLIIFGHPNGRFPVYTQYLQQLEKICADLDITEIYDIGVPIHLEIDQINHIPIIKKGFIGSTELSSILQNSIASFASFPIPDLLGRSTIFAAYCAHRLLPVYTLSCTKDFDGLKEGIHYLSLKSFSDVNISLDRGQEIADNAYSWYRKHDLRTQAKIYCEILGLL